MENSNEETYRMYVLVERHLSPIDKGIQAAHAIVEFGNNFGNTEEYLQWSNTDKTIIVLNGGVVEDLVVAYNKMKSNDIPVASFEESDLNNIVTAVAFIASDKVFDKTKYYDFDLWYLLNKPAQPITIPEPTIIFDKVVDCHRPLTEEETKERQYGYWEEWIGHKNVIIREIINNKRLAN